MADDRPSLFKNTLFGPWDSTKYSPPQDSPKLNRSKQNSLWGILHSSHSQHKRTVTQTQFSIFPPKTNTTDIRQRLQRLNKKREIKRCPIIDILSHQASYLSYSITQRPKPKNSIYCNLIEMRMNRQRKESSKCGVSFPKISQIEEEVVPKTSPLRGVNKNYNCRKLSYMRALAVSVQSYA